MTLDPVTYLATEAKGGDAAPMQCYACAFVAALNGWIAGFALESVQGAEPLHLTLADVRFPFNLPLYPKGPVVFVRVADNSAAPGGVVPGVPIFLGPVTPQVAPMPKQAPLTLAEWRSVRMSTPAEIQAALAAAFDGATWAVHKGAGEEGKAAGPGRDGGAGGGLEAASSVGSTADGTQPYGMGDVDDGNDNDNDHDADDDDDEEGIVDVATATLYGSRAQKPSQLVPIPLAPALADDDDCGEEDDMVVAVGPDAAAVDVHTGLVVDAMGHGVGNEDEMESIEGSEEDGTGEEDDEEEEDDSGDD